MPKNYNDIYNSVYVTGNSMSFGNTMLRGNGIPLDITEVYNSYAKAVEYAATNAVAYEGQFIAVTESGVTTAYIITNTSQGKYPEEVTEGTTQYDVYLKPIGVIPEGDGKTIEVTEAGAISLLGAAGAANGTLPMIDSVTGKLVWKTLEDIGAGDGNDDTTYLFELNETGTGFVITPYFNDVAQPESVYEVDFDSAFITNNELSQALGAYSIPESSEGAGDAVAATGLRAEIELKANKTYVDSEIEAIEEAIGNITHFTTKIVTSTDEINAEGILYLIKDEETTGGDKYNEYLYINGEAVLIGDTTTDLSNYYTKEEVDNTTNTLGSNLMTLGNDINDLRTNTNAALEKKIETGSIAHTSEGVTEGVTADGTELKIVVDAYTKSEVYTKSETDTRIDEKIASVTGGESAADVKLALESYRDALNKEVWGDSAGSWTTSVEEDGKTVVKYEPAYGNTSRIDALESGTIKSVIKANDSVKLAIETDDNKNVTIDDSALVQLINGVDGKVATANELIQTNANNISNLDGRMTTAENAIEDNAEAISGLDVKISGNTDTINQIAGIVNDTTSGVAANYAAITTLQTNVSTLTAKDTAIDKEIADLKTTTGNNSTAITQLQSSVGNVYTKTEADGQFATIDALTGEINRAKAAEKANADALAILNGVTAEDATGDTGKSVRAIAVEEIAKVVANAPADFDTLKEIADWIQSDTTGAAAMQVDITKLKNITAGIGGTDEPATVLAAIEAAAPVLATLTTEGETTTATQGLILPEVKKFEMSAGKVTAISTDLLVQGEKALILNGGNASGTLDV